MKNKELEAYKKELEEKVEKLKVPERMYGDYNYALDKVLNIIKEEKR